jgi:DNA-binding NarL/FixJ family response regulator
MRTDTSILRFPRAPRHSIPARRRVLLVGDSAIARHAAARVLATHGFEVVGAATVASAVEQLRRSHFVAVVAQTCLRDGTAFDVFHAAREQRSDVTVILVGSDPHLPPLLPTPAGAVRYCRSADGPSALATAIDPSDDGADVARAA